MSDERVETLLHRISWDRLDVHALRSAILDTLRNDEIDEELIHEVFGGAEHTSILRRMYATLSAADLGIDAVRQLDLRARAAARGPHFFNLILIMYYAWSQRWREANGYQDVSPDSDDCDSYKFY